MVTTTRIVVVDDQPLLRMALTSFFETVEGIDVVGSASDGAEAVELIRSLCPDVVVMDLDMPVMDGIEATRRIAAMDPRPYVLVLTNIVAESWVRPALEAGADGFMLKDSDPELILQTLEDHMTGEAPLDPQVQEIIDGEPGDIADLSPRELDAVQALAQGLTNRQIAEQLFLSEPTVKSYLTHAARKLGVSGRVQLLLRAAELGLVRIGDPGPRGAKAAANDNVRR